jgi:hypothetical protein
MESVKSINPFKSVIQTSYDIIKAHGRQLKAESKKEKEVSLLFNYQLSESRIIWIKRLHGEKNFKMVELNIKTLLRKQKTRPLNGICEIHKSF